MGHITGETEVVTQPESQSPASQLQEGLGLQVRDADRRSVVAKKRPVGSWWHQVCKKAIVKPSICKVL
jgi:hypothetical protein